MKRFIASLAALLIAGCGGGGSSPAVHTAAPGTTAKGPTQKGTLSLTIGAQSAASSLVRKPKFVSPNATSAAIAVNGVPTGTSFDISSGSSLCTGVTARTCQLTFDAPIGNNEDIAVALMSGSGTNALLLGQGSNSVDVVAGTPFSVTVGINAVVEGALAIAFSPSLTYGASGVTTGSVTFTDPSGAPITGSGNVPNFLVPMTLTSNDPHVTFTLATLTTPGQTFSVTYDGSPAVQSRVNISIQMGSTVVASNVLPVPGLVVTRYNLGAANTINPQQMTVGGDGNIWVALNDTNDVARINVSNGAISTFPSGLPSGRPLGIAADSLNNIYVSDALSCNVARMSTSGVPSTPAYTMVNSGGCALRQMVTDTAGNVWVLDSNLNTLEYMPSASWPGSTACNFTVTSSAFIGNNDMKIGSDNAIWFTEGIPHKIGRVTDAAACVAGSVAEYPVTAATMSGDLFGMALGSDGNLWFPILHNDLYANISTSGVVTAYPNLINDQVFANPVVIAPGPPSDGQLWITQGGGAVSFKPATPTTLSTQFFSDNGQTDNHSSVLGPDGNIWFAGLGSSPAGFTPTQDEVAKFTPR